MAAYERLRAWEASHRVVLEVYKVTESWPKRETYGLTAQVRRAAFSIAANIAEGVAKRGPREFRRFLDMGIGSSAELKYALRVALDLGLLPQKAWEELELSRNTAGKTLWRLYQSIARRA